MEESARRGSVSSSVGICGLAPPVQQRHWMKPTSTCGPAKLPSRARVQAPKPIPSFWGGTAAPRGRLRRRSAPDAGGPGAPIHRIGQTDARAPRQKDFPPRKILDLAPKGVDPGMISWYNSVKCEHRCADSIATPSKIESLTQPCLGSNPLLYNHRHRETDLLCVDGIGACPGDPLRGR